MTFARAWRILRAETLRPLMNPSLLLDKTRAQNIRNMHSLVCLFPCAKRRCQASSCFTPKIEHQRVMPSCPTYKMAPLEAEGTPEQRPSLSPFTYARSLRSLLLSFSISLSLAFFSLHHAPLHPLLDRPRWPRRRPRRTDARRRLHVQSEHHSSSSDCKHGLNPRTHPFLTANKS